jgi:maltose O-acetyltransferase
VEIDPTVRFVAAERIVLGDYVYIGPECTLEGKGGLDVGDGTVLAPRVTVLTSSHEYQQEQLLPYHLADDYRPVTVGRGVWIGWGAMLVPGVSIGDGAVVAMGAVVTQSVTAGQVVGGNPAREIGRRPLDVVERLVREEAYFLKRYWGQDRRRPAPPGAIVPSGGSR